MSKLTQEEVLRSALRYQDALTGYAFALLRDWALAEDAVQDAFVAVSRNWESFDADAQILPWIKGIVRNKAVDIVRSRTREKSVGDPDFLALLEQRFDRHLDENALARIEQRKSVLQKCMSHLGRKPLDILLGFYRDRKSCEDLAGIYQRSVNAIRLTLSRIRKQLRECARKHLALEETA